MTQGTQYLGKPPEQPVAEITTVPVALDYLKKSVDGLLDPIRETIQALGLPDAPPPTDGPKVAGSRVDMTVGDILRMRETINEYRRLLHMIATEAQRC